MNCNKAKCEIDQLYLNQIKHLSDATSQHIADCPTCSEFYKTTMLASQISNKLKSSTPVLNKPEQLTNSIMLGINEEIKTKGKVFLEINFQRLLAAASICLFIIFGYEQYNVLAKINRLETQTQAISQNSQKKSANMNGSLEGFLLIKYNFLKKNAPEYFNNIKLDQYRNQEILASLNQLGVSSLSMNELKQFVEANRASFDNSRMDAIQGSLFQFKN